MLNDNIRSFINSHLDELDEERYDEFFKDAADQLALEDEATVCRMLRKSGIDFIAKLDYIPEASFYKDQSIRNYTVQEGIKILDSFCFASTNIESVSLPSTLEEIHEGVFESCDKLDKIVFNGTMSQWNDVILESYSFLNVPALHVECTDGELLIDDSTR